MQRNPKFTARYTRARVSRFLNRKNGVSLAEKKAYFKELRERQVLF
jgi:hypothetical protein